MAEKNGETFSLFFLPLSIDLFSFAIGQLGGPQKEKLEEFKAIYSRLTAAISDLACYSLLCDFKL